MTGTPAKPAGGFVTYDTAAKPPREATRLDGGLARLVGGAHLRRALLLDSALVRAPFSGRVNSPR